MTTHSFEHHLYHPLLVEEKQRFWKRILIVDDDADITVTFKTGIEDSNMPLGKSTHSITLR